MSSNKSRLNLLTFACDQNVLSHLFALNFFNFRAPVVFQSELFKQITELRHLEIPKANLLRGLTMISNCITPVEMRCMYLQELMAPIEQRFFCWI